MKPPYRADQVGSLLRPKELAAARAQFKNNEISSVELKAVEDKCITQAIQRQESSACGPPTEMRRDWWHWTSWCSWTE
jgi:5-methyltetrahydropteroyltriglutamate--homocysteine methyltransferase